MPVSYARAIGGGTEADELAFMSSIQAMLGSETRAIPVGRARMGLHLLVKLAVQGEKRRVLLSPFTIPDVVAMVVFAGGEPVFYDFEPGSTTASLDSIRKLIDARTACVIVTHYHVNEWRLAEISEICRKHSARLFDDCAIAFGGRIDGRPIGTLTDASVFSFSSFKLLNFFWGGLITTRDPELADRLAGVVSEWPRLTASDYGRAAKACLRYDLATRPIAFKTVVFPLIQRRAKNSNDADGVSHTRVESDSIDRTLTSRPALAAFAEWTSKIDRIEGWLARRREIAALYRDRIGGNMVTANAPKAVVDGSCFVNFPVLVPPDRRQEIARAMMLDGFDVGLSLYANAHKHPKYVNVAGESVNVDTMAASTIYLPTHFGVSAAYACAAAERLATALGR